MQVWQPHAERAMCSPDDRNREGPVDNCTSTRCSYGRVRTLEVPQLGMQNRALVCNDRRGFRQSDRQIRDQLLLM
jgi:hypothetical protein